MTTPHVVLVPLLAQGHIIPMLDLAHLLASRGVHATFVTTPINAARIQSTIDTATDLLHFAILPFPCATVGLPDGHENLDIEPSADSSGNFFRALSLLRQPLESYLHSHHPPPTCIVSDYYLPWTLHVARAFQIPRLSFFGMCSFYLLCTHNISHHRVFDSITDDNEPFLVPGLNHMIEVTRAQAPGFFPGDDWKEIREEVRAADEASEGVVINSFEELEPWYVERYEKALGKKVWPLGPMSLFHRDRADVAARGNDASVAVKDRCVEWLGSMKPKSVVYVSFGSVAFTPLSQLMELGLGLEASGVCFIWVLKTMELSPEVERWLSEGFEGRVKDRGVVVRGWAPQVVILSHPAVGGFMTHCGWNSSMEGIVAGVPMITWPSFADQFLNERLIVDVLRVGASVGVKESRVWGVNEAVVAGRDEVVAAVRGMMGGGGEEMRERVMELAEKAKTAMEEGGSSHENMTRFIKYVSQCASNADGTLEAKS